jgi:hypothetical protein
LSLISNHTGASNISYTLETYEFGGVTASVDSHIVVLISKKQCKKRGWTRLGFRNQGQCIAFVNRE